MPRPSSDQTVSRKREHVEVVLSKNVGFMAKTTGLGSFEFEHNALPEIDLVEITTGTVFLGKSLKYPLLVSSMTGGYKEARKINQALAEVCEEYSIAMGVGSQRQALESAQFHKSFSAAREAAPSIPIFGNIGAAEVASMKDESAALRLVDLIQADALAVHLNPLQEFLQPEGNTNFRGVLAGIERLVQRLPVPVIVKEIGAGLSGNVVRQLQGIGVQYIDVAGAGGTSWAGVEILRRKKGEPLNAFWDWGIPTARAVREASQLKSPSKPFTLIASGGISSGLDAAKCIALGADMVGVARPVLQALSKHGKKGVRNLLDHWIMELRGAMFLTGSIDIHALQHASLVSRQ